MFINSENKKNLSSQSLRLGDVSTFNVSTTVSTVPPSLFKADLLMKQEETMSKSGRSHVQR